MLQLASTNMPCFIQLDDTVIIHRWLFSSLYIHLSVHGKRHRSVSLQWVKKFRGSKNKNRFKNLLLHFRDDWGRKACRWIAVASLWTLAPYRIIARSKIPAGTNTHFQKTLYRSINESLASNREGRLLSLHGETLAALTQLPPLNTSLFKRSTYLAITPSKTWLFKAEWPTTSKKPRPSL